MHRQTLIDHCLRKPQTYVDLPFGPQVICVKVCGRIVAQFFTLSGQEKATLKCTPEFGFIAKQTYPGAVLRGYHCPPVQQPYWITVPLDGQVPDDELARMADHAYESVLAKLPKRLRESIQA